MAVRVPGLLLQRSSFSGKYTNKETESAWWGFQAGARIYEEVSETGPQTTDTHHGQTEVEPEAAPHQHVWSGNEYQLVAVDWDEVKGTRVVRGPYVKVCFRCGEIRLADSEVLK